MRYHRVRSPALFRAAARTLLLYWFVLSLTFVLLRLAPGDPATFLLAPGASAADAARLRSELGLDRRSRCNMHGGSARMLRGDLGESFVERRPVAAALARRAARVARAGRRPRCCSRSSVGIAIGSCRRRGAARSPIAC